MSTIKYNIGDLVTLKQHAWGVLKEYNDKVGMIIEILWKDKQPDDLSFTVRFENVFPGMRDRIIWHKDINKHYPVLKV